MEGAFAKLDPQVEWIEAESSAYGRPGPIRGREAVLREVCLPLQRDWERITVEPGELIELPAGVLALVHYRGVATQPAALAKNLRFGALAMLHDSQRARRIAV